MVKLGKRLSLNESVVSGWPNLDQSTIIGESMPVAMIGDGVNGDASAF